MARPSRRTGNLPAEATSFIGRRRELVEVRKKLTEGRLVSLVGPGGVGKSRLAIRIGTDLTRSFRDGAWLVELADLRDSALVSNALMASLDLRDQAVSEPLPLLLSYLKQKELLLIVDNCEHLLPSSGAVIKEILKAAPAVRVIATSRQPLGIDGEHVIPVPPLDLPSPESAGAIEQLRHNEAVMLFAERAEAASGKFELTEANKAAVVDLCRRLDGLPLAIELAAVRTRALGVEQIRQRLNDRFNLLTASNRAALPRHQTLRTAIDWSHELLSSEEKALMRRLSPFSGRFALEDVEGACAFDSLSTGQIMDLLSSLVDRSMVMKEDTRGIAGYRLHETMREYAFGKLTEAGEGQVLAERLVEYYRSRTGTAGADTRYRIAEWLDWMDLEIDNIRHILAYCAYRQDSMRGLDIVTSAGWYWITRATTEGIGWLDRMLALGPGRPEAQFWAYFQRGFLAVLKADPSSAPPALEKALSSARELGEAPLVAQALSMSSIAKTLAGDREAAARLLAEAKDVAASLQDYPARISVLQARCLNGLFKGDLQEVGAAASEGVRLSRGVGDLYSLEMMLLNSGAPAMIGGDHGRAKTFYWEALRIAQRIDDRVAEYALLDSLGCVAAATGQPKLAAHLIGAAETIRTQAGAMMIGLLGPLVAEAEETAANALGRQKFEAEVEAGRKLSREEAIRLGLGESAPSANGEVAATQPSLLGKREADVARLVADGLSNKQIGARLFISERTVDSHVRSILNKLGFNSRAQIASWVASAGRPAGSTRN